ncbi:unnamed protein product [Fusarium fujikuroi]|uniref:Uncharacterized protein n=1 Tax=Fusarium fujikuroi TaxID=5127 RepID=A0A9Q9RXZ8_FUSFU|nr:unnamed protein product [Fusarium fujikuroi]VTT83476.1 unnamed protein product [Fusarium fujikuroi]VZH87455.1 unnamed protein product [Fusarium fujikuroi]
MSNISTEQIVTILSTIPGLLMSCVSAWFAYLALQRHHVTRNDIETATIEFIITHISAVQSKYEDYGQLTKFSVPNPSIAAKCSPCTKLLLISYFRAKIYPSCHLRLTEICVDEGTESLRLCHQQDSTGNTTCCTRTQLQCDEMDIRCLDSGVSLCLSVFMNCPEMRPPHVHDWN